jgi:hypothetical protein
MNAPESWLRPKGTLATSVECKYVCLRVLFQEVGARGGFQVPLFQRRYCWGEPQWAGLWAAVTALAMEGPGAAHSLKRVLTLRRRGSSVARVGIGDGARGSDGDAETVGPMDELVLDGQQRLTTCCVLLAAVRTALTLRTPNDPRAAEIHAILFPAPAPRPHETPDDDAAVTHPQPGCVLRPTLDDGANFTTAMSGHPSLPGGAGLGHAVDTDGHDGHAAVGDVRLLQCRAYFDT